MEPAELVAALREVGAAGCNLEDTDHAKGELRDRKQHAEWLRAVRQAADADGYGLVINARVDVWVGPYLSGSTAPQADLVDEALGRAHAYAEAGADCVYPIALGERDAIAAFIERSPAPVNLMALPKGLPLAELTELGAARVSYAAFLYREAMQQFGTRLAEISAQVSQGPSR
jgi:2-methylisocitrate lyase-like PEP mutase family enzyme